MSLSVAIITLNEEANLARTLASVVRVADEVVIVDSGSTDRTLEIARGFGPTVKIYTERWKGYAGQKNSALGKCSGEWILSLDADEEVSPALQESLKRLPADDRKAYFVRRRNMFLGRWMRRGGFYPDAKLRLFRRGAAQFEDRPVHETVQLADRKTRTALLPGDLIHHAYPTLTGYIEHMNRYSALGAGMVAARGKGRHLITNAVVRPAFTFLYNYVFRLGFLDGREGLLQHLYHATYVSWKYAKAWELQRPTSRK